MGIEKSTSEHGKRDDVNIGDCDAERKKMDKNERQTRVKPRELRSV